MLLRSCHGHRDLNHAQTGCASWPSVGMGMAVPDAGHGGWHGRMLGMPGHGHVMVGCGMHASAMVMALPGERQRVCVGRGTGVRGPWHRLMQGPRHAQGHVGVRSGVVAMACASHGTIGCKATGVHKCTAGTRAWVFAWACAMVRRVQCPGRVQGHGGSACVGQGTGMSGSC